MARATDKINEFIIPHKEADDGRIVVKICERVGEEIGTFFWKDGCRILCRVIQKEFPNSSLENIVTEHSHMSILELGAGLGTAGLFSKKMFDIYSTRTSNNHPVKLTLTDLHSAVLTNCEKNVKLNFPETMLASEIKVEKLAWFSNSFDGEDVDEINFDEKKRAERMIKQLKPNLILGSECVYEPKSITALVDTIVFIFKQAVAHRNGLNCRLQREENRSETGDELHTKCILSFGTKREAEVDFLRLLFSEKYVGMIAVANGYYYCPDSVAKAKENGGDSDDFELISWARKAPDVRTSIGEKHAAEVKQGHKIVKELFYDNHVEITKRVLDHPKALVLVPSCKMYS